MYLRDVARTEDTFAKASTLLRFNVKPSLGLSILPQSYANAVAIAVAVYKELGRLEALLPPG